MSWQVGKVCKFQNNNHYQVIVKSYFAFPHTKWNLKCIWQIFSLAGSKELSRWWRMAFTNYCNSTLGCQIIIDFDLCKLEDLWRHIVDTKLICKITKYGISLQIQSLQGWNFAGLMCCQITHCDSDYDVTIATYSLPDLYLSEMKNAFFVAPDSNRPPSAYAV